MIVGHIAFTICALNDNEQNVALLAPLAVSPASQKQGVGTKLVKQGLRQLEQANISHVLVLGDPAYYSRFGFETESKITPPYPLPEDWRDAWQSLNLSNDDERRQGKLIVPKPWQQPSLWTS